MNIEKAHVVVDKDSSSRIYHTKFIDCTVDIEVIPTLRTLFTNCVWEGCTFNVPSAELVRISVGSYCEQDCSFAEVRTDG